MSTFRATIDTSAQRVDSPLFIPDSETNAALLQPRGILPLAPGGGAPSLVAMLTCPLARHFLIQENQRTNEISCYTSAMGHSYAEMRKPTLSERLEDFFEENGDDAFALLATAGGATNSLSISRSDLQQLLNERRNARQDLSDIKILFRKLSR